MSSPIELHPIIENAEHLKQIIKTYGTHAFRTKDVSKEILDCINFYFIDNKLYQIIDVNEGSLSTKEFFMAFWPLFEENFKIDKIDIVSGKNKLLGKGNFGIVYEHGDGKVIKYLLNEEQILVDIPDTKNTYFRVYKYVLIWIIEFCTFIVVTAILKFIDCGIIENNLNNQCFEAFRKNYKNDFDIVKTNSSERIFFNGYYSFLANIDQPFVKNDESGKYLIGYIMDQYDDTLDKICRKSMDLNNSTNQQNLINAVNVTYQTMEIFRKFSYLNNLGIIISHRDATPGNIMIKKDDKDGNKFKIKLIDYGFFCVNIKFKEGKEGVNNSVMGRHGFGFVRGLNNCDKKTIDVVFLLAMLIMYYDNFFQVLDYYAEIKEKPSTIDALKCAITFGERQELMRRFMKINPIDGPWDYAADLQISIEVLKEELKSNNTDMDYLVTKTIFETVFNLLDRIKKGLIKKGVNINAFEIDNNEKIDTYNINDTQPNGGLARVYRLYEQNKDAYLGLAKSVV
jgi:serine/threonine protein kinase